MKKNARSIGLWIMVFALIVLIAYMARGLGEDEVTKVSYSKFAAYLKEEKISEIKSRERR